MSMVGASEPFLTPDQKHTKLVLSRANLALLGANPASFLVRFPKKGIDSFRKAILSTGNNMPILLKEVCGPQGTLCWKINLVKFDHCFISQPINFSAHPRILHFCGCTERFLRYIFRMAYLYICVYIGYFLIFTKPCGSRAIIVPFILEQNLYFFFTLTFTAFLCVWWKEEILIAERNERFPVSYLSLFRNHSPFHQIITNTVYWGLHLTLLRGLIETNHDATGERPREWRIKAAIMISLLAFLTFCNFAGYDNIKNYRQHTLSVKRNLSLLQGDAH